MNYVVGPTFCSGSHNEFSFCSTNSLTQSNKKESIHTDSLSRDGTAQDTIRMYVCMHVCHIPVS